MRSSAAATPELTIGQTPTGQAIPPGFLGLSLGFRAIEGYAGTNPLAINPVLVALIRKSAHGSTRVAIKVPGASGAATVELLRAPSLSASKRVTLAGQSFGTSTTTGLLTGPSTPVSVAQAGGDHVVQCRPQAPRC